MTELSDDLGKEMKKIEAERHKSDIDRELKELGAGIHKVTHEISEEFKKVQDSFSESSSDPTP